MRLLAILLMAAALLAQNGGGTLTGTVVDLAGDTVANAPIQATNTATHTVYKATS